MEYIAKIETEKIDEIKSKLNVTWESNLIFGLIAIDSELSEDEILSIDGIVACEKEATGTFL